MSQSIIIVILSVSLLLSAQTFAKTASLKQCKTINSQVENYRNKRKKGGNGKNMTVWKIKLREYEVDFKKKQCRRYGNKLRP